MTASQNQHRVAEAEEAVALLDRDFVGAQRVFAAHQGRDEHQQRALRQVEVGDQRIHRLDGHAGGDEDLRKAAARVHDAVLCGHGFQRAHARGAHAHDPAPAGARGVDRLRLLGRHLIVLAVHVVVGDIFLLDRAECAQPHVQQHGHDVDALGADALQQLGGEVQPGRRRGGAAVDLRVDGLVARAVRELFVDVGGKRHLAEPVEHVFKHALIEEAHRAPAVLADGQDLGGQFALAEHEARAGFGLLAGLEDDLPVRQIQAAQQQKLDGSARALLDAVQAGGNDARLVDHQHVAGVQVIGDVAEDAVLNLPAVPVVDEQAAAVARLCGRLRDEFLRKFVVKIACLHGWFS